MKENAKRYPLYQRWLSFAMAAIMVFGILPVQTRAETTAETYPVDHTTTVADPDTVSRPVDVYGDNTENAGKITVGKSVSDSDVTLGYGNTSHTFTPGTDNFIVTVSQTAQILGLASESSAPVDVVFVLDTSSSMSGSVSAMVGAANNAIKTLLQANENNRVSVVAFSGVEGGGTSNRAAANVLSPLNHYNGDGETAHLTYSNGNIYGRGTQGQTRLNRKGTSSGTNIHAGVVVGAQQLMNATDITVDVNGKEVTRIPFLVVMSDGQPSYAGSGANWYNPTLTSQLGNLTNQPGLGFLPALTAAYYKGAITDKYFGANASNTNRCFVYTMGLGLQNLSRDQQELALMTVDPSNATSSNRYYDTFEGYWSSYNAGRNFNIKVSSSSGNAGNYQITAASIEATENYVNGKHADGTSMGYTGGYKYNDWYFSANQANDLAVAFQDIVVSIQQQAMASPTHVDAARGDDFSGYVTFTDPIGEYMEVKQMYGVLADGHFYQGKQFAKYVSDWDNAPQEFKTHLLKVLKERCNITGTAVTDAQLVSFLEAAAASANQANYDEASGTFDNSLVWWGNGFLPAGEEDEQVQWLGFADNDSIEYITDSNTQIPADADYVCRSYYFNGTAGGTVTDANTEYLHFIVRVQRSLKAPYQETVVISAPASLLSVERVMITETTDASGDKTYSAVVTEAEPARVVYEVGLRSDINAFNVDQILAQDANATTDPYNYTSETAVFGSETVNTNYDAATGTYTFYTNDWDRTQPEDDHERAMTKATFDAAADNSFYTYTEDTPIYVRSGNGYALYTGNTKPVGTGYFYAKEVYDWSGSALNNGAYAATKRTVYVEVDLPDTDAIKRDGNNWYISAGVYKASALTGGEDVYKSSNDTDTSVVVAHPHRTVSETNSHYTVYLGNNGKLTLKRADTKTVDVTKADGTIITDADGNVVMVGDTLTYHIQVVNGGSTEADAVVTDIIPTGTAYVAGSADNGGVYDESTKTITWNIAQIPAGSYVVVSFQVTVTEDVLSGSTSVPSIDNVATVTLDNNFSYTTNPTHNPPEGKKVVDSEGEPITDGVEVHQVLVYRIRWHNDSGKVADVTVTDIIPAGTTYIDGSADEGGVYDAATQTITWTIEDAQADASGVVSFRVNVNAAAGETIENDAEITIGENNPRVTNRTKVTVEHGDLVISKTVNANGYPNALTQEFTLNITEIGLGMNGTYTMLRNGVAVDGGITFTNGVATVTIKHGETIEIQGIPAGAIISVTEAAKNGFTPSYTATGSQGTSDSEGRVTVVKDGDVAVAVTNTYDPAAVSLEIKGTKTLQTTLPLAETTFGFTAYPCDANGNIISGSQPLTGEVTVSGENKTATITFAEVTFDTTGTYYYLISEINGGVTGVTYAENQYLLTVEVTDNGSGALQAAATLKQRSGSTGTFGSSANYTDTGISFVNTYAPLETQLTLEADKELVGRDLKADEFSFVVTEVANGEAVVVSTGTNDAQGNVTFRPITYTAPGVHTYTVTEVRGSLGGVGYSTQSYTVTVTVEDKNGQLVATASYPDGGIKFVNTYTPTDVSLTLTGDKTLTGRDMTAGEFQFLVTDNATGEDVATGSNDASGRIIFTAIGYSRADVGEHTYTVSEVVPDLAADPNLYYDPITFQVKVTVSYDPSTGLLSVSDPVITDKDGNAASIAFANIQNPDSVEIKPVGTKTTSNAPDGVSFSFSVINTETGNEAGTGVGAANGDINFSVMSYSEPGTYTYWILESNAGNTTNGITYDSTRYLMKVVVSRNATNKLVAEVTYWASAVDGSTDVADYTVPVDAPSFENAYNAAGYINITAGKELTGRTLRDGEFAFKLIRQDNGGEIDGIVAADGTITFATMYYSLADLGGKNTVTIHYVMSEVIPDAAKLPGVTYDAKTYDVYVKLTDMGNGVISAELVDENGNALGSTDTGIVFENAYAPVEGTSATIEATKVLTGRPLAAGEFGFELYHVTATGETLVATATNAADGKISFTRHYPANILGGAASMQIKYVLREIISGLGGVTYSGTNYWIIVTITDNTETGVLERTVKYYSDADCTQEITDLTTVKFENTYDAEDTTYTPTASKVLKNRTLDSREFAFVVKDAAGNVVSTGYNNADGTVTFSPIGYTQATPAGQPHVYTVYEVEGNLTGVTYDDAVFYLAVTVTDDGQGNLVATGEYFADAECKNKVEKPVFTNIYTPQSISLRLEATKVLTGHDMRQGNFSFLVYDITDSQNPKLVASGGNAAAKAGETAPIIFSDIGYTFDMLNGAASRVFIYSITEQDTTLGGVTKDDSTYYAKVMLSYDDQEGTLTTSVEYYSDSACTNKLDGVPAFVNTYEPNPVNVTLYADKTLINKDLKAGEFTFTLKSESGETWTAVNDENGRAVFTPALTFTAPGTYIYTITEAVSAGYDASRYTLDDPVTVVITVTDDLRGQLHATVTYHVNYKGDGSDVNLGGAEFINRYTAPALTVPLSTAIDATKTVEAPDGVEYSPAGFKFVVTDAAGNPVIGRDAQGNPIEMIGVSDENGVITFPDFYFPQAGAYTYWIREMESGKNGITDDARVWEVHILVRYDESTGLLYVSTDDVRTYLVGGSASGETDPDFLNIYQPAPVSLNLTATKVLEGRELRDREFMFYLMEGDVIVAQGYNDVSGIVKFELNYTEIGIHTYKIVEFVPENGLGGVTYNETVYSTVTVEVKDNGDGQLVVYVDGKALDNGATISTGVTITNKYQAEGTTAKVHADKVVTGGKPIAAGEYTFILVNTEDPDDVYTAVNDASGKIEFTLSFNKAGVYTYTMSEKKGTASGITYDDAEFTVTVTVTDDLHGKLHASVTYEHNTVPTFVNEYNAAYTTAEIKANKTLLGNKLLVGGEYTFELEREDGVKVTTTNDANGNVVFNLRYDKAGIYTYILREQAGDAAGTTYDTAEYKITVTVTDDLNGNLKAEVSYDDLDEGKIPGFVNSYKGEAVPVKITANKTLTGKTLTADAYTFTLTNKDNAQDVVTAKNDANGNVAFNLTFTEVGTYTYILAETKGTDANTTYDETLYTVTIKVTDDLEGKLKAEVTYSTADGKAPAFKNVYTPSSITVELEGTKKLTGRKMQADEFSFEVRDSEGNVVAKAKNTADGKLKFSAIELKAVGKYTFTVTEVKGSVKGMIYDDAKFTVTVEVTNDNGVLKAEISYPKGGVVFENTYKDPDPTNPGTGDDTPLFLLMGMMFVSGGAVVTLLASRKKRERRA